jgi:hypothetical protein
MRERDELDAPDEAIENWGETDVKHAPFYRMLYYPDVLDLRRCGYEVAAFAELFDRLDGAVVSQARVAHELLHQPGGNAIWNPHRARQIEFSTRAALHRFGLSDAPTMLRRMLGRAFPGDSVSHLAVDLLNVFFWAALAQIARDYAWRMPQLAMYADYLEYPVVASFGMPASEAKSAA